MSSKLDCPRYLLAFAIIGLLTAQVIKCDNEESKTSLENEAAVDDTASDPEYIKKELKHIFSLDIDKDKDGLVSYEELRNYLTLLNDKTIEHNVDKQWRMYSPQIHEVFSWEGYEPESKEVLTWEHYFNQTYPELSGIDVGIPLKQEQDTSKIVNFESTTKSPDDIKKEEEKEKKKQKAATSIEDEKDPHIKMLKLMVHRADARWKLADENGDTLLTRDEFKFLWHPEEGNAELQNLFIKEATEDMDSNRNLKIELDEFMKHLGELASENEKNDELWLKSQKENFGKFLDKNKDGVLDSDEIRKWLIPEKAKKFDLEAKRLLDIGDKNEDLRLSQTEFLANFDQYVNLLPPDHWDVDDEVFHDGDESPAGVGQAHDEL